MLNSLRSNGARLIFNKRSGIALHREERTEKTKSSGVPLSRQLVNMLKLLKKESKSNFVFTKDHLQPIRRETPRKLLKDGLKLDCTMHGMRSTFRDWCTQNGVNEIVAEKSLMHSTGNEVVSAYQRSDLLEERREVMQKWADLLLEKATKLLRTKKLKVHSCCIKNYIKHYFSSIFVVLCKNNILVA